MLCVCARVSECERESECVCCVRVSERVSE